MSFGNFGTLKHKEGLQLHCVCVCLSLSTLACLPVPFCKISKQDFSQFWKSGDIRAAMQRFFPGGKNRPCPPPPEKGTPQTDVKYLHREKKKSYSCKLFRSSSFPPLSVQKPRGAQKAVLFSNSNSFFRAL